MPQTKTLIQPLDVEPLVQPYGGESAPGGTAGDHFKAVIRPQVHVRGARLLRRPLRMLRGVYPAQALTGLGLQAR